MVLFGNNPPFSPPRPIFHHISIDLDVVTPQLGLFGPFWPYSLSAGFKVGPISEQFARQCGAGGVYNFYNTFHQCSSDMNSFLSDVLTILCLPNSKWCQFHRIFWTLVQWDFTFSIWPKNSETYQQQSLKQSERNDAFEFCKSSDTNI